MVLGDNSVLIKLDPQFRGSGFSIFDDYNPESLLSITGTVIDCCNKLLFRKPENVLRSDLVLNENRKWANRSSDYLEDVLLEKGDKVLFKYTENLKPDTYGNNILISYSSVCAFERNGEWTAVNNKMFIEVDEEEIFGHTQRSYKGVVRIASKMPKKYLYSDFMGDNRIKEGDAVYFNAQDTVKMESVWQNIMDGLLRIDRQKIIAKTS